MAALPSLEAGGKGLVDHVTPTMCLRAAVKPCPRCICRDTASAPCRSTPLASKSHVQPVSGVFSGPYLRRLFSSPRNISSRLSTIINSILFIHRPPGSTLLHWCDKQSILTDRSWRYSHQKCHTKSPPHRCFGQLQKNHPHTQASPILESPPRAPSHIKHAFSSQTNLNLKTTIGVHRPERA